MGDVLSALLPPAVVATVFCTFIIKLLRKEMAPRTSDGRLVKEVDKASGADATDSETVSSANAGASTAEGGTNSAQGPSKEVPDHDPESGDR